MTDAEPPEVSPRARQRSANLATPRMQRELETIGVMTRMYCKDHHGAAPRDASGHCEACAELFEYQHKRLLACPFSPNKPTCSNCQVHCFGPQQREQTRQVMRYAGPRMVWRHPVLALGHVIDGHVLAPPKPRPKRPPKQPPHDPGHPDAG